MTNTPSFFAFIFALSLPAPVANAQEAALNACEQAAGESKPDLLDKKVTDLRKVFEETRSQVKKLDGFGPICTKNLGKFRTELFQVIRDKVKGYDNNLVRIHGELEVGLCRPGTFPDVDMCVGFKSSMIKMLADKKKPITDATRDVARMADEVAAYNKKLHTKSTRLMGHTPYSALIIGFTPDWQFTKCPKAAENTVNGLVHPSGTQKALLNNLNAKMADLEKYLETRGRDIDAEIAEVEAYDCQTAGTTEPLKADAQKNEAMETRPVAAAPEFHQDEVKEPTKEGPEVIAKPEKQAQDKGSEGAVLEALREQKRGEDLTERAVASTKSIDEAVATPVVVATTELKALEDQVISAPENIVNTDEIPKQPDKFEAPIVLEAEAIDHSKDNWGAMNYEESDRYKESIGAPNIINYVDLDEYYGRFVGENSINTEAPDYGLRLQKAINATALENGDSTTTPSAYQDELVGSRTISAVYQLESDPVMKPVFQAQLRKQGLIR